MHAIPRAVIRAFSLLKLPLIIILTLLALTIGPAPSFAEEGTATWYGQPFHGRTMAGGQVFDMYDPTTTACNIYPLGTWLKVTNPANGHTVTVQVRDRGGFSHALDLSYAAFAVLDNPAKMQLHVQYEVVSGPEAVVSESTDTSTPATQTPTPQPTQSTAQTSASSSTPTDYTVVAGDSLYSISRRFGIDVVKLMRWNNLDDSDWLVIGQHLTLREPTTSQSTSPSSRSSQGGIYQVAEGDTLWSIANKFGTTPERLTELNDIGDLGIIVVGQSLRLPNEAASTTSSGGTKRYTVQPGDTLLGIALDNGTDVETLLSLNGLSETDYIVDGQILYLP